jgi:hypothetical protein
MTRLERHGSWEPVISQAVDDLLRALAAYGPPEWTHASLDVQQARSEARLFRWDPSEAGLGAQPPTTGHVRELLTSYSMRLLTAGALGTGSLLCDDGSSVVDCEFILRPNDAPYYRCVGHTPPDCYDVNHRTMGCP